MKKEQQESCFSKPSSSTDVASRPLTAKRAPPLTNLRRFQGHAAGFLSLTHKRASIDQHGEQVGFIITTCNNINVKLINFSRLPFAFLRCLVKNGSF